MAQAPVTVKGAFTGTAPSTFNEDRARSKQFMREFTLFRALNDNHELILNPYKRVIVALSFFKGPKIEDWAADQLTDLNDKVTRANNPVGRDEEILWMEFKNAFTRAFTDTTQKQQAYCELHALRMQGSDLDSYILKFKHLAKKAGYDEAADATIDMFAKRLNRALLDKILDRDTTPITFDEWVDAARKEQQKYTHKTSMMSTTPSKWPTTWNTRSQQHNKPPRRHPNDETVPMDVDTVCRAVTEEDKKKHHEAGKCFECSRIGHMARNCSNRKGRQTLAHNKSGKFQKSKQKKKKFQPHSFIRAIKEVDSDDEDLEEDPQSDEEETEKPLSISELAAQTSKFTTEQRNEWVQEMKKNGVDFQ